MKLNKLTTSFSRGLNQAASHTIQNDECSVAQNFVFKDRSASVRKGYQIHAQVTSSPIVDLEKFYQADGDTFFVALGNGQVHYSITSGVFNSLSTEPISGDVHHVVFDGAMYFTDFSTPVKWFNGNGVGMAGLSSPQYRLQIDNCEDATKWTAQDLNGGVVEDTNYMHRDFGDKALTVFCSGVGSANAFT
ncbi:MAG TPA: hypothetical protein VIY48_20795, partial [Candidatus Paceibacterota bacterium]